MSNETENAAEKTYTPPPVIGYRKLTQTEINLVNEIKEMGNQIEAMHAKVMTHLVEQSKNAPMISPEQTNDLSDGQVERLRINRAEPGRWAAIAKTHYQEAAMALARAVFQPTTF